MRCMPRSNTHPRHLTGFTLVEMLIVAPIVLLTIAIFIGTILYLTGETLVARTSNILAYEVQDSLNSIEYDVATSGAFLATNSVTIASPQGYNNATQNFANASTANGTMLIINTSATSDSPYWSDRQVIPLQNMPHACGSSSVNQNQVMTYNIVYFVKDNALWRRTLMPSNYLTIGCNGQHPWQKPSCASGMTGTMCQAKDIKLLDGVSAANFTIQYFTTPQSSTPVADASSNSASATNRQIALSTTDTAHITIHAVRSVAGKQATYTGTLRVSRVGPLTEHVTPVP